MCQEHGHGFALSLPEVGVFPADVDAEVVCVKLTLGAVVGNALLYKQVEFHPSFELSKEKVDLIMAGQLVPPNASHN